MSTPAGWYPQPDGQQRYWDGESWTAHFAPGVTPGTPSSSSSETPSGVPSEPQPTAARKNWFLRHKVLTAIGAVLVLGIFSSLANGGGKSDTTASVSDAVATTASPEKVAADKAAAELAAANQAATDKAAADQAAADKAAADKAAADAAAAAKAAENARNNPASYKSIGTRQYALLVKNPDAHIGEKYVVYGHVTQFDSATGTDTFRANTASSSQSNWYDYDQNTIATAADTGDFDKVVNDDLVTMYVEVLGSLSYDTQIGGNTTVPNLKVHIIKVTGSSK